MSVTSIRPVKRKISLKWGLAILGILSVKVLVITLFQDQISQSLGIYEKATLSISTREPEAEVFLNNNFVGKTPIESISIKPGLVKVMIKPKEGGTSQTVPYETALKIVDGSENIIYRNLGISTDLASGVNIWEDKSEQTKIDMYLKPKDAKIFINEQEKTLSDLSGLSEGEHRFQIEKDGYQDLDFKVSVRPNFKTLIDVSMLPLPYDKEVTRYQSFENVFVVKSSNPDVYSYTKTWLDYLRDYQIINGIQIQEIGLIKGDFFSYYIDPEGKVYDHNLKHVDNFDLVDSSEKKNFALLHKSTSRDVVTDKNSFTLLALLPKKNESSSSEKKSVVLGASNTVDEKKQVKIKGEWVRIRLQPDGQEIGRAKEGEVYELISKQTPGWYRIKVDQNQEGYISVLYSEEVN